MAPRICQTCKQGPLAGVHMPDSDGFDHEYVQVQVIDSHPSGSVLTSRDFWKFIGAAVLVGLALSALRFFWG